MQGQLHVWSLWMSAILLSEFCKSLEQEKHNMQFGGTQMYCKEDKQVFNKIKYSIPWVTEKHRCMLFRECELTVPLWTCEWRRTTGGWSKMWLSKRLWRSNLQSSMFSLQTCYTLWYTYFVFCNLNPSPRRPRNNSCYFTSQETSQGDFVPHSGLLEKEIKRNGEGK